MVFLFRKVVTHAQIWPIIVIRKLVDVFARRIVKALTVANVCQTPTDIRIKRDANFAIVIMVVRLDNPAICIRDNVFVVKDSPVVVVIGVRLASSIIHVVNDVAVIWKVQFQLRMPVNRFRVMRAANARAKHL